VQALIKSEIGYPILDETISTGLALTCIGVDQSWRQALVVNDIRPAKCLIHISAK